MICHVTGGLGNQMFQYAAGYSAAKRLNTNLKINKNFFGDYPNQRHVYHLHHFKLSSEITTDRETPIYEPHYHYSEINADGSLYGYWQSEKYFQEHAENIRQEFYIPKVNITSEYVMVSVRRTDYLTEPDLFNILDEEYYEKARKYFPRCKFIGFGEDTEWMKKNLKWLDEISENKTTIEDFKLMCSFKKYIIANSTFSWWAAWLSGSNDVIAPGLWFVENAKGEFPHYDTKDLIPDRWEKI
jgi:hypothetical protein